jgi:hypothetical protein
VARRRLRLPRPRALEHPSPRAAAEPRRDAAERSGVAGLVRGVEAEQRDRHAGIEDDLGACGSTIS